MTRPILDLAQGSLIVVLSIGWWVATGRRAEASARYEDARMITLSGCRTGFTVIATPFGPRRSPAREFCARAWYGEMRRRRCPVALKDEGRPSPGGRKKRRIYIRATHEWAWLALAIGWGISAGVASDLQLIGLRNAPVHHSRLWLRKHVLGEEPAHHMVGPRRSGIPEPARPRPQAARVECCGRESSCVSAFRNAKRWCGSTLGWRCGASLKHLSGEWGQCLEFEEAEGTLIPQ